MTVPSSTAAAEPVAAARLSGSTAGPGGCRVLCDENRDLPLTRVALTLLTGAADDPYGLEGMATFASDLACRAAAGRGRDEIDEAFERLGADLAVSADADSVSFDVEVLSRNLEPALDLLCDCLLRPDLPEDEADKLRREMLASLDDLRDENGPLGRRFFGRQLYGTAHPYGKPSGGTAASIGRLSAAGARRWLERAISGGNLIASVAGDLSERAFCRLLERRLGVLRPGGAERVALPPPPTFDRGRGLWLQIVDKPDCTQSQLFLGQPAVRRAHPDYLPLSVATTVFGGTFTSRLMTEVRVKRGLSYGAGAAIGQSRGARALSMSMAPALHQTAETIELVLGLFHDFVTGGVTDDEVAFAREHMAASFAFQTATPEDRIDLRTALEVCELPADTLTKLVPDVRAVTPAQVKAALAAHLRPDDLVVTVVSTAKVLLPQLEKAKLVPRRFARDRVRVVPYDSY